MKLKKIDLVSYKDNKCDWRVNLRIHPCYFYKSTKAMLGHTRTSLENGWLMIDNRFDKLLIALHTASDIEGRLDKNAMSHSDCFDGLRMCLTSDGDFTF